MVNATKSFEGNAMAKSRKLYVKLMEKSEDGSMKMIEVEDSEFEIEVDSSFAMDLFIHCMKV